MKHLWLVAVCVVFAASAAMAQNVGFREVQLQTLDLVTGEMIFDQAENKVDLLGNAEIVLHSANPGEGNIRLRARTVQLLLSGEENAPNQIRHMTMNNNVIVEHPDGTVRAEHGEWDVQSGELVFTGNPVLTHTSIKELQGDRIEMNLETGKVRILGAKVEGMQINKAGEDNGGGNPFLLSSADITDWPSLISSLQTESQAAGDSPGKRILDLVAPEVRAALPNLDPTKEPVAEIKSGIIDQLNRVLSQGTLYTAEAWAGITVPADAQSLIDKGIHTLPENQVVQLNRRLLEAAYPAAIAPATVEP